jgi:subtilisin family serine protease
MNEIRRKCITLLSVVFLLAPLLIHAGDGEPISHPAYKPGEILVKMKKGVSFHRLQPDSTLRKLEVKKQFSVLSQLRGREYLLLKINDPDGVGEGAIAETLRQNPGVEAVSLNYIRRLFAEPNDPLFPRQWGLYNTGQTALYSSGTPGADINAIQAWDIVTGSPDVVIAVIDTGVDYLHEDLRDNMWRNPGEIPGNGIDDDGNNYVDDYYGYDFAADLSGNNDSDPMGLNNHGTHVAGIIAAKGNNGIGTAGVCWDAKIMAVKAFRPSTPDPYIYTGDALEAFEYVITMKTQYNVNVVVINCSYGGSGFSQLEADAIVEAGQAGIVVVAASGNGGADDIGDDNDVTPTYPASYDAPNMISVAATDNNDQLAEFSNFGTESVDIAAPGMEIKSTTITGQGDGSAHVEAGGTVYNAVEMEFCGDTNRIVKQAYACGKGLTAGDFPAAVKGNIALIERGDISFADKAANAQNAGALAAIIFNNVDGIFLGTLGEAGNWIPVFSMSRADGLELVNMGNPVMTLENLPSDYGFLQGTSMSAPFVSGALGLLASRYPQEGVTMRITRILLGAEPQSTLLDRVRTGARLNIGTAKIQAPLNLQAQRIENRSFLQTEYINVLTWQANPQNQGVTGYRVFLINGNDIEVVADLDAGQYEYMHRGTGNESQYTYAVTAVGSDGSRGEPAVVSL